MEVAFGLKAHSGWAAIVAIGVERGGHRVIDRRRIELIEDRDAEWAGQPYHAAEGKPIAKARAIVERGIADARRAAVKELRLAIKRTLAAGHDIVACAVLMPAPMPEWSTEEILAVHFRMHKAEGVLYPDALARAAQACGLQLALIHEKQLAAQAEGILKAPLSKLTQRIAELGKTVGAPWGADQKNAALAAMIALATRS